MAFFDEITNFLSGGKQKGAEQWSDTLGYGMNEMRGNAQKASDYLNPYNQAGMGQMGSLQSMIARMMNPGQFNKDLMSGYSTSPQAQHQIAIGNDATTNAALAAGMGGSTPHLNQINEQSQQIANRDGQQYFQNMMGINDKGMGASQHMYDSGQNAATNQGGFWSALNGMLGNMYNNQGQAKSQAEQGKMGGLMNLASMFI